VGEFPKDNKKSEETNDLADRSVSVATDFHAIYRIVSADETNGTSKGFENVIYHVPSFPSLDSIEPSEKLHDKRDENDAAIVELLLSLDWKINLLIKTLAPIQDTTLFPHRAVVIEMSTAGIRMRTSFAEAHPIGTVLEFHFVLPILPFKELFLKGEIVSCSTDDPQEYRLSLYSNLLKGSDREHIIRYVVRRQFQIKRDSTRAR
jgi:hypothetical protein